MWTTAQWFTFLELSVSTGNTDLGQIVADKLINTISITTIVATSTMIEL